MINLARYKSMILFCVACMIMIGLFLSRKSRKPGMSCKGPPFTNARQCLAMGGFDVKNWKCIPQTQTNPNTCALELILGHGVHITIAFFTECPSTIKQEQILSDILHLLKHRGYPSHVPIDMVPGIMHGWFDGDSKCITGLLAQIKHEIMQFLIYNGSHIQLDLWGTVPHTQVLVKSTCLRPSDSVHIFDRQNWRWSKPMQSSPNTSCLYE